LRKAAELGLIATIMQILLTIIEWLSTFDSSGSTYLVPLLMLAIVLLLTFNDWRVLTAALFIQYLAVDYLFLAILDARLVLAKIVIGVFVALIMLTTGRQTDWQTNRASDPPLTLRLAFAVGATLTIWWATSQPGFGLPFALAAFNTPIYALSILGAYIAVVTREPFKAGCGLLLFLNGFELFYNALEQSLLMMAALAATHLLIALITAYLTLIRHHPQPHLVS
jgi:hypothetical protein